MQKSVAAIDICPTLCQIVVLMSIYNRAAANKGPLPRSAKGFLVKVKLNRSEGKGIGAFADQFIKAKTTIAQVTRQGNMKSRYFNEKETIDYLESLPSNDEKDYWLTHVYGFKEKVAEDPFDLLMINHSSPPNMLSVDNDYNDWYIYAARDIQEGEELTEDYNSYSDLPFLTRLKKKHNIVEEYLNK